MLFSGEELTSGVCGGSLLGGIFSDGGDEQIFEWWGPTPPMLPVGENTVKKGPNFKEGPKN